MKSRLNLGDSYKAALVRIKALGEEKTRLGMGVLMWISHSRRPLQVDEICHAVGIRVGSNDLDNNDIPEISTLIGCCQGLITIDRDTSTIRLINFTLQEYLCAHPNLFDRAHSTMAETCLTYLNFKHVKALSAGTFTDPQATPFLEYSSLYWGTHMRMGPSARSREFALQLLGQFDGHISAKLLWKSINGELPLDCDTGDKPFSALHCVSYFGIAEVINALIEINRWDVNETDGAGVTPLIWAARYGHEEAVRLLLQKKDIQPDQQDGNYDRTALSWAAGNGHERIVRLLLGRKDVNPNNSSKSGRTPLSWAAENGREGVVELLLGPGDVNPNSLDRNGRPPISYAAAGGHGGVVKLLVESPNIDRFQFIG